MTGNRDSAGIFNVSRHALLTPCLIASATCAVYLAAPTKNYFFDGLKFAQSIEDSKSLSPALIDPNHLIYRVVGYLVFRASVGAGLHVRALSVLQSLSSFVAALTTFLFFCTMCGAFGSPRLAAVLTLLLGFSATWWKFATDADCYIPSVFFLVICFHLLLPERPSRPWLVAAAHSTAMVFHQIALPFFPAALVGLLTQTAGQSWRRRLATLLVYVSGTILLTSIAYTLGFSLTQEEHRLPAFLRWITTRAPDATFRFSLRNNLLLSLRGNVRLFLGGRVNFAAAAMPEFTVISIVVLTILFLLLSVLIVRPRRRGGPSYTRDRGPRENSAPLLWPSVTWVVAYLVFLFFWLPQDTYYRLFYLPAILTLLGVFLKYANDRVGSEIRRAMPVAVAIIALSNFTFLILPYSTLTANPPLRFALEMNQVWRGNAVVYYATDSPDVWLLRYFSPGTRWLFLEDPDLGMIEKDLKRIYSEGHKVWIETSAIDALTSRYANFPEWLEEHSQGTQRYQLIYPGYRFRIDQVLPLTAVRTGAPAQQANSP